MNEPHDMTDRGSCRRLFPFALYVCLLAAVAFAAWQVTVYFRTRGASNRPAAAQKDGKKAPEFRGSAESPGGPLSPDALVGMAGVSPLRGDPGGMPPPAGAVRRCAVACPRQGMAVELANYEYHGSVAAAAAHYEKLLAERGFDRLSETSAGGAAVLTFQKRLTVVTVSLRKVGQERKIVSIDVAVRRQTE
ncbi:MAG: hypothetical protein ACYTF6_06485 [Planctomycetota bacterium]|jgi:hypothetical protein